MVKGMQSESKDFADHAAGLRAKESQVKETARKAKDSDSALEKRSNEEADELSKELQTLGPPRASGVRRDDRGAREAGDWPCESRVPGECPGDDGGRAAEGRAP